jgi:outer membrane protein assembly complex protein YaeT
VPLHVGQPRDRQLVLSTHELALNELKDHGYPYAKVNTAENDGPGGKAAVLTFTAEPGKVAHFGEVNIQGNKSVSNRVIARQLTFKPGELYRRSLVQDSQRRLYGLELFQFANIEAVNPELQPAEVPVRVTVAEGNHHRVNFGVGYGTEEKGRVDAEYHHLNFFGGARTAGAHVRYSGLDRGIRLDFTQPYFFGPHVSLNAEGQHWLTFTPAYESTVTGAKGTVTHRWSQNTSASVSLSSQRTSSSADPSVLADPRNIPFLIALGIDPSTGQQNGTLNTIGGDLQHSTADNLLNAHHGYQLALHLEQAGPLLPGSFKYTGASIDARHYLPIAGERFVLASRLQIGAVRPTGNAQTNIPLSSRFFLGGATSVRGWGRYEISPTSASGVPIGGDSMLAFSEEVRATIQGNLGGVLFLDAGNVWSGWSDVSFSDLRYAVGPGLRYQTPVGPIRFDFGYQLNPIPGLLVEGKPQTRRWRIHFSIGQAF